MAKDFFYRCINCGNEYNGKGVHYICTKCEITNTPDLPPRGVLKVIYPFDGSVFPPELGPPEIKWESTSYGTSGKWVILFFCDGQQIRSFYLSSVLFWRPPYAVWEEIKKHCKGKGLKIVIAQRDYWRNKILAIGSVEITFAASPVIGSILYREVNLPFSEAVKDPSKIRWRFGSPCADSQPPVVLEKLPVCGNCHSFSAKGTILSMDVDYANDKGSYGIIGMKERVANLNGTLTITGSPGTTIKVVIPF